ncbi:InlB B-repeat-containing protein [Lysinibacillus sp. NPDC093688]|uniref:InlB B-repeat-containing protein n=1 Tax=Lysinibacillus sp. NPDC093688 TaxID=3390577 RepID=UPI003D0753C6
MKKARLLLIIMLLVFSQLSLGNLSVYASSNNENDSVQSRNLEDESVQKDDENKPPPKDVFITKDLGNGVAIIKHYFGIAKDYIIIPSEIGGKPVIEIGHGAFSDKKLTSVEIPSSVIAIGELAFSGNKLTNVDIPSNVRTIGQSAFYNNQLTTVKIPEGVKTIEAAAFYNNRLTNVEIPSSVTTIQDFAFTNNKLTSLEIPSSVTSIGTSAFNGNPITSLEIPESVTTIKSSAFYNNSLDFVTFNGSHNFQWTEKNSPFNPQKKEGRTFLGWFEDEDFTKDWDYTVVQPMTIYAKWSHYAVTFDSNGGSKVPSIMVAYNEKMEAPSNPVKEGYAFEGWYKDKELKELWDFDQDVVKKDITLYAKWKKESYIVTFDANGGSEVPSQTVGSGELVKAPSTPVKEGYTFEGWYKDKGLTEAWNFDQDVVEKDITLYVKWKKVSYIVTFDANGGSEVPSQSVESGELIKAPSTPVKAGYTFGGWYKDKDLTEAWDFAKDVVTKNVTLYAKWTKDHTSGGGSGGGSGGSSPNYKVIFDSDGGSKVPSQTVGYNDLVKAPTTPVKEGYRFDGWYKEAALNNAWDFAKDKVTADITLYAKWTKDYIVTFDSNGGSEVPSQTVPYKALVKVPTNPKKEGYLFIGWYKNKKFTKAWDFAKDVVTEDLTLYARWMKESHGCDITFKDIDHNWAQDMIKEVAERCIIIGFPDGTFLPNDMIQRQHVVLMIDRALQPAPIRDVESFSDVPKNHVNYEQITRLQRAGIVDGSNGAFRPNASITRAEMAKVIVIAFGLTPEGNSTFKDVDPSHWASRYIAALADHNIALGDENGNFRPNENLTRAEFTAIIYRALGL